MYGESNAEGEDLSQPTERAIAEGYADFRDIDAETATPCLRRRAGFVAAWIPDPPPDLIGKAETELSAMPKGDALSAIQNMVSYEMMGRPESTLVSGLHADMARRHPSRRERILVLIAMVRVALK